MASTPSTERPAHTPPALTVDERAARLLPPGGWVLACAAMVAAVGAADYLTGTEVALILFYLAPIGFGTWFVGLRAGAGLATASAAVSVGTDLLHRFHFGPDALSIPVLVWNGLIQLGTSLSLVLVLSALRARLEGEELLARTDALTHIANRRAFLESMDLEIERARRTGRPLALAYVDADDFKDVNDRLGHAQGDALLVAVAQTLRSTTRAVDSVARLGGDEFGLLLPETSPGETEALLARVRATLLATMQLHGWKVGFSMGAAVFLEAPESPDELMARADELMYAAKRSAKGSIRVGMFRASVDRRLVPL